MITFLKQIIYIGTSIYRTVHEKIRDFQCLLCGQTFGQKSSLQKHEVYHTGIKKFECFCGKVFATQNYLHRHKNSVHEKPKYKCQYCEKWFHTPERLKRHVDPIRKFYFKFLSLSRNQKIMTSLSRYEVLVF